MSTVVNFSPLKGVSIHLSREVTLTILLLKDDSILFVHCQLKQLLVYEDLELTIKISNGAGLIAYLIEFVTVGDHKFLLGDRHKLDEEWSMVKVPWHVYLC